MHTFDVNIDNLVNPVVDGLNAMLSRAPAAVFSLLLGILIVRILSRLTRFILGLTAIHPGLRGIIGSVVEIFLWIFFTIRMLDILGFANVIVFFSSSALAIGILLAAGGSTLLSDIIAGIFLARDGDFNIGDEVVAGENETQGIIESMDARRTRLRDKKGILHVIPNAVVERKEWVLIRKSQEISALQRAVKTAKKIRTVALETKAAVVQKKAAARKNAQ